MNHSIMMGRLVRDPEINYVENSKGDEMLVANFRLAVDRKFSDETDFFPCAAFGRLAEFAEKYLFQGIKIVVNGRMENNNYTNKDGDKVYGVCLKLDEIEFAESKNAGQDDNGDGGGSRNRGSGNRRGSSVEEAILPAVGTVPGILDHQEAVPGVPAGILDHQEAVPGMTGHPGIGM